MRIIFSLFTILPIFKKSSLLLCLILSLSAAAYLPAASAQASQSGFDYEDIVNKGHAFFGSTTDNLAKVISHTFQQYGEPNAYIMGQEASGAIIGGLRYGEGILTTLDGRQYKIFWQGPSIGFDMGGDGARTMILVYNLGNVADMYRRYGGIDGSAFLVGGIGVTALGRPGSEIIAAPIRTGVGGRLGVNVGYLKFRNKATWNPF